MGSLSQLYTYISILVHSAKQIYTPTTNQKITAYPSGALEFIPGFSGVRVTRFIEVQTEQRIIYHT
jgi:hypothetical protein